ncbi:MAG TPA: methylenetetrahydrofolate reductase [NAD(P)H] [Deltaproteobacteria bacterium]|nr:methylenetetrahydrofolate reductase [NAD(P)H] [Deltaproteobacteria bacterium]
MERVGTIEAKRLRKGGGVLYGGGVRIDQILARPDPVFSFEFFPPKTDAGREALVGTIDELKPLDPAYVSVTYGAMGSNRGQVIEIVSEIKNRIGIEAMAHLTCVGHTREELSSVLDDLASVGIENVLALRGDPPPGTDFQATRGGFAHAADLVALIRKRGGFCIGGAAYPEVHPDAPDAETDLGHLRAKVGAGTDFLVSQLFFDNQDYFSFLTQVRQAGIEVPVLPGIMPVTNLGQVKRFTDMCGAALPADLLRALEEAGDDEAAVLEIGVEHALQQCRDLLKGGAPGVHFYTLNKSASTREILTRLRADD